MKRKKHKETNKNDFKQIGVETSRWFSKHLAAGEMTDKYVEDCSNKAFWMSVATWGRSNWKSDWPIPPEWRSDVSRPINLMSHGQYGGTIWSLAYAATAVNFDWRSQLHPGIGHRLWLDEYAWEKGYDHPDKVDIYSLHPDPITLSEWQST